MQIEIRLRRFLQELGKDNYGIVTELSTVLKVNRHTAANWYHNRVESLSLEKLGRVCEWLIDKGVSPSRLPHELFAARPSGLWRAVAGLGAVRIYIGAYQQASLPAWRSISLRDAAFSSEIVKLLSRGSYADGVGPEVNIRYVPFVFAPAAKGDERDPYQEDFRTAETIFKESRGDSARTTFVLVGSQRSNYLVEPLVADLFGCKPFCDVRKASEAPPFYTMYRDEDNAVPSCFGGRGAPPGHKGKANPGVFYRDSNGAWVSMEWKRHKQDAGILIVAYDSSTGRLDLAALGFSGRGTGALGHMLLTRPEEFWKEGKRTTGRDVRVYVCRFEFPGSETDYGTGPPKIKLADVIEIDNKYIKEYRK